MALNWSSRRQFLYLGVVVVLVAAVLLFFAANILSRERTCSDGVQNGSERGVDCGGACSLVCAQDARAPQVLWARAFKVGTDYTVTAYVQNHNIGAGAKAVAYVFQLYDASNSLIIERAGVADLPPITTIPIVETGINAGERTVARVLFAFSEVPLWRRTAPLPQLHTSGLLLSADGSRLTGVLVNDTNKEAQATVLTVLFNAEGTALAASKSILPTLARRGSQPFVFTFPGGAPGVARAEVTILPAF